MPKDVNNRSSRKSRAAHYHPYSNQARGGISQESSDEAVGVSKEWEDATCPICMECPHNAVLLLCSSHDNGCRPYMCDTSYRHSNCLDQYKKLSGRGGAQCSSRGEEVIHEPLSLAAAGGSSSARTRERSAVRMRPLRELLLMGDSNSTTSSSRRGGGGGGDGSGTPGRALRGVPGLGDVEEAETEIVDFQESEVREPSEEQQPEVRSCSGSGESLDLMCPLCRGKVVGWKVVEQARRHLNCKSRNCAQESCGFTGSYDELRKHARCVHPFARPSDVDPARQRDWRHLERERDIGDVLSTIQSAMPGARILGDYVIDEDNDDQEDEGDDNDFPGDDGNWWTVFLLFQVFGPVAATGATAGGSSIPSRLRGLSSRVVAAAAAASSAAPREALWGEDIQMSRVGGGGGGDEGRTGAGTSSSSGSGGGASSNSTAAASAENGGEIVGPSTTRRRRSRHHHQHHHHHHQRQQQQ